MKIPPAMLVTLVALAACSEAPRNLDAVLDVNTANGQVLLSCKASSSGTCYAIFVGDGKTLDLQAAVGASASTTLGNGGDYCVDVSTPDPARCHPRPLSAGKNLIRLSQMKAK